MVIYFSQDGWRLLQEDEGVFFSFIDPGHCGAEIKIEIDNEMKDYLLSNKPGPDVIMKMLKDKGFFNKHKR
ncbi:hypothetical protein D0C16_22390 [Cellvibrio sp. KY-GH-1]|uniref:hypothetical protein n=1 Tax=Cellvibrio sp. KY-GH-1 TaxID=2303332 RepID=UPI00124860BA|nr:hypothetical protein [Cellvibrio sp. KY-GH-1]QEY18483.1 hypothetical protein D0C16_22390 [Cellvibrio sp. KY-GH-1]